MLAQRCAGAVIATVVVGIKVVVVVVVEIAVVVTKVMGRAMGFALVMASQPLHVLSHRSIRSSHKPLAKARWHWLKDNLLRLLAQRCAVVVTTVVVRTKVVVLLTVLVPAVVTRALVRAKASHPLHVLSHSSTKSPHKPLPKTR